VRIRSALLGQQVIAIVPECNQTKITNRCVSRGSVADHHTDLTAQG
jgi:hypothetical protein